MQRFVKTMTACVLPAMLAMSAPTAQGQPEAATASGTVALIGYVGPLTNPSAPSVRFAKSLANAVELAIDDANRQKIRIGGQEVTFRLLAQDDRSDLRTAPLVAQYLLKRGIIGVIGHGNTGTSMAAAPIYHGASIPLLAPTSAARAYTTQGFNTSFRLIGHSDRSAQYLAQYVGHTTSIKRVAVLDNGAAAGHAFATQFVLAAAANGINIVSHASVSAKTSDFNGVLDSIKKQQVDAVVWGGLVDQAIILVHAMRRMQLALPIISGANSTVGSIFLEQAGAASYGVIAVEAGQPRESLKGWKNFQRDYESKFDDYIDPYAPLAYDATQALITAARQANSLDPAKITAALHSLRINGLTGPIAFNEEGDLLNPTFSIYRLEDGDWKLLQTTGSDK